MNSIKHKPAPHSKDLRKGRDSQPNQTYLLTTVTYQRQPVFNDFYLGRLVVRAIRKQHQLGTIDSLAFVVMPDHLHWLCTL
jgi:REP element-mobilizing transposase RayT